MKTFKESKDLEIINIIADSMEYVVSNYNEFPIPNMWKYSRHEEPIEIEGNSCTLRLMSPLWDIYNRGWTPSQSKLSKYYTEYVSDYLADIEDEATDGIFTKDTINRRRINLINDIFKNEAFYYLTLEVTVKDLGDNIKRLDFNLRVIGHAIAKSTLEFDTTIDDREIIEDEIDSLLILAV